jgi:hypothetical protein
VVSAPVFAELMADPGRTESFVSSFLEETGIAVEWDLGGVLPGGRSSITRNAGVNSVIHAVDEFLLTF